MLGDASNVFIISIPFTSFRFWSSPSENCPETRIEIAEKSRRANRDDKVDGVESKKDKFIPKLFNDNGHPYCLNHAKLEFIFSDEEDRYELDLHVYK